MGKSHYQGCEIAREKANESGRVARLPGPADRSAGGRLTRMILWLQQGWRGGNRFRNRARQAYSRAFIDASF